MSKYRIKELVKTFRDGHQERRYVIQHKSWFWWEDMEIKLVRNFEYGRVNLEFGDGLFTPLNYQITKVIFDCLSSAKDVLDFLNDDTNNDIDIALWGKQIVYYWSGDNFSSLSLKDVKDYVNTKIVKDKTVAYHY